jgi:predicted HicB family RNase H-like nuclease
VTRLGFTSVTVSVGLHERLKTLAADRGLSIGDLISRCINTSINKPVSN